MGKRITPSGNQGWGIPVSDGDGEGHPRPRPVTTPSSNIHVLFDDSTLHEDACLDYIHKVEKNQSLSFANAHWSKRRPPLRGLGRPAKRFLIKDFLNLHFADICCLQESKLESIPEAIWREIGGPRLGDFGVSVDFYSKRDNFHWRCTSVHGPNARHLKTVFWEEIRGCCVPPELPWVIYGDFNAIFLVADKRGGPPNLMDIRDASSFLNDLNLFEPPMVGRRFTTWAELFPRLIQNCLPRLGSDHIPIRLEVGMHCANPRLFRFELAWTSVDSFANLVSQWWTSINPHGCGAFVLAKKLAWLRDKLRIWSKESFGSIKLRKLALLHDLELLDIIKESRTLTSEEAQTEFGLWERLGGICKQEEMYWKQQSVLTMVSRGDENTKYFHSVVNSRKNTNFLPYVRVGNESFSEARDIGKVFETRFRALFEEVKKAVFDLGSDKAPGPDGFPMMFCKTFWEIVKVEVMNLCEDFFSGKANLECINWASIALIPKISSPASPSDYRPISLINSSLKIISKILASRLSMVIDPLVDNVQSVILKERCILDNIATAEELLFSIHKRRLDLHVLKVDFAKAFDSVDWDFLFELLKVRGFGARWLGWIQSLLSTSKASILINGSPKGYARYQNGLRQGDPLSPLLFILVTDILSAMFENALNSRILIGVPVGELGSMCNLHYADDLLILTTGGSEDLKVIKLILLVFEGLSGEETNFAKTCLFSTNLNQLPDVRVAKTFSCDVGLFPVNYLGIPISGRHPFASNLNSSVGLDKDARLWSLATNGSFSIKSFYEHLNDGGLRCSMAKAFWKGPCPRKVNILNCSGGIEIDS
ncbi:uncharacterized protein LOC120265272 [Dioscorea cayenensis subsp. rotundata]|uniref:Uncharacterized protein LOC120265272 n=1 Tax=Dioscorea cayennensis subsp. rotundata TaxID=55577 RepID=A0AB40BNV8_DIOCR|nr:uncharacterized protein LOC120265272 [Dioscorea cayenensis subsp. rotundata]